MGARRLEFWFDFGSTYSYPAALRIEEAAGARGLKVAWRPFLLGPIFRRQGWDDSPYNLNPLRGAYMWRDVERICRRLRIPFRRPGRFPRSGLLASRVCCLDPEPASLPGFCRAVFLANFGDDRDIASKEVIREILDRLGEDGAALIERAETPDGKERLRRRTAEAEALGLFGAPHFVVGGEVFWGNDRLEEALDWSDGSW
jgi:2-hydroxychromene-2-carboxylate isomerase